MPQGKIGNFRRRAIIVHQQFHGKIAVGHDHFGKSGKLLD